MNATKERVRAITASQGDGGMISIVLLGLVAIWAAGKNTAGSVSNPVPIDADALRDAQRRFAEADRKREIEARERKLANDRAYEEWLRTQPVDDLTDADRLRIGLVPIGAPLPVVVPIVVRPPPDLEPEINAGIAAEEARRRKLANDAAYDLWLRSQPPDNLEDFDRLKLPPRSGLDSPTAPPVGVPAPPVLAPVAPVDIYADADEARERKLANDRAYEEWLRTQPVDDLTDADRLRIGLAQGAPSMAQMFQGRAYVRGHFKGCDTYVRGHFRGG